MPRIEHPITEADLRKGIEEAIADTRPSVPAEGVFRRLRQKALLARQLHSNGTDVERRLWRALRESGLPWKFRRQHPIGRRRIVDFACPSRKLVIELDGGQHTEQAAADLARTEEIASHGYRIIRFWNNEVIENLEGVLETIRNELDCPGPDLPARRVASPSPPFRGEKD